MVNKNLRFSICSKFVFLTSLFLAFVGFSVIVGRAQSRNTISGNIFDAQRQPLGEVTVELMDDLSRTIARTRTNSSGRYFFGQVSSGRFKVKVLPYGSDFEQEEQEVEIQNFSRDGIMTGFDNVQRDFYLKKRKSQSPSEKPAVVFVQEVPPPARASYQKALTLLDEKKTEPGLKELKNSIELFPEYFDALERLGLEYVKLKYYNPAHLLLNKATEVNPRAFKSWYGLAFSLYALDALEQSLKAVEQANSLSQYSIESHLLSGTILRRMKKFAEAERDLKKANELAKGTVAEAHWQLALLYGNNLKRYKEAADELELFLKLRPNSKDIEEITKLIKEFREKSQK